ncbi:MAG: TrkH family potassium uptake protein [Phycisphaerae bacterium]
MSGWIPVSYAKPLEVAVRLTAIPVLASIAFEHGFRDPVIPVWFLNGFEIVAVVLYLSWRTLGAVVATKQAGSITRGALRFLYPDLIVLSIAILIVWIRIEWLGGGTIGFAAIWMSLVQFAMVIRIGFGLIRLNMLLSESGLHPARAIVLTFVAMIVGGTLLLSLPRAVHPEVLAAPGFSYGQHMVNCAFTATSATCVTGLAVYDTGRDFTLFGQVIILVLIQLGGLGIMLFGSFLGLLLQRQLSLRQSLVLQDELSHQTLGSLGSMMRFVIISTLGIELVGAVLLYPMWQDAGQDLRFFYSIFHAVSAFCNAGFALQSDSLVLYRGFWQVYVVVLPLITLGGLGFPVLHELWSGGWVLLRRFWNRRRGFQLGSVNARFRLSLHTKIVFVSSTILVIVPMLVFFALESWRPDPLFDRSDVMFNHSAGGRLLDSLFLSVTCRTAGFNSVGMDIDALSSGTRFMVCLLMFIGGAPASTAGGVKVVAIALLVIAVMTQLRGRRDAEIFHRALAHDMVQRAGALVMVMFAIVSAVTLALCAIEHVTLAEALFESVSACGTVGLSNGLTPTLSHPGRLLIMLAMFAGRLGPLTVLIAMAGQGKTAHYSYPVEPVSMG